MQFVVLIWSDAIEILISSEETTGSLPACAEWVPIRGKQLRQPDDQSLQFRTSRLALMSAEVFRLSRKAAELYLMEVSKLARADITTDTFMEGILSHYHDLHEVFSKKASNELPSHSASSMKIEFKEGQGPRNTRLWPMSSLEL